ncbi:hypothetical protein JJD41_12280 [Oxynema sp. CENA135]|uniref:hypothetical protein n=1 Tax=Oxynema sp. CENA135 TaxID=984206 RepID=UPI00190CE7B5|nr:hypothetical protein [Oxynema sp. CENA135]MBK4730635.1 hypothetical protein [Oxynema sp. CENA135]
MNPFILIFTPYLLLLIPGIPYQIGLLILWLGLAISSYKWPAETLIPFSFIISSYNLIRIKSPDTILLAGFRTEIIFIFISCILLRKLFKQKLKVFSLKSILFYYFFLWCLISLIANSSSTIELVLAIRENLLVWFLFPFVIPLLEKNYRLIGLILTFFCLGGALVATFNIIIYYQELLGVQIIPFSSLCNIVTLRGDRALLGIPIPRMISLYCIPPGGGAVYNASLAVTSFFCAKYLCNNQVLKRFLLVSTCILAFASTLTVSISALGAVVFGNCAVYARKLRTTQIKNIQRKFNIIISFIVLAILGAFLFPLEIIGVTTHSNIVSYLSNAFLAWAYEDIRSYGLRDIFFGQGVFLATGHLLVQTQRATAIVDKWWIMLANRVGLVGLIFAIMFVVSVIYKYLTIKLPWEKNIYMICSGSLMFSLLAYIHGCPLIAKPLDYGLMISLASVLAIARPQKQTKMIAIKGHLIREKNFSNT